MAEKVKARKRYDSYKHEVRKTTVGAAVPDAYSELEQLRDEMQEMVDNMEGANMGHMPKCEMAQAALDELDQVSPDSPPDVPESLDALEVTYTESVIRRRSRAPSRSTRCSNATAMLQAVRDLLQGKDHESSDDAKELVDSIDEAADVCPEFPGMYG